MVNGLLSHLVTCLVSCTMTLHNGSHGLDGFERGGVGWFFSYTGLCAPAEKTRLGSLLNHPSCPHPAIQSLKGLDWTNLCTAEWQDSALTSSLISDPCITKDLILGGSLISDPCITKDLILGSSLISDPCITKDLILGRTLSFQHRSHQFTTDELYPQRKTSLGSSAFLLLFFLSFFFPFLFFFFLPITAPGLVHLHLRARGKNQAWQNIFIFAHHSATVTNEIEIII